MARFIKRGNSWQYEISYKKQDGTHSKLRKSGFKTKREAKEAADEIEYNLKKGFKVINKISCCLNTLKIG